MNKARQHQIDNPVGSNGITFGIAMCSCGAQWRVFYSRSGMEWEPLNEKCAVHDAELRTATPRQD